MFRDAQPEDRRDFMALWTEYLKEIEGYGGGYAPDEATLQVSRNLFDAYLDGSLAGVCILYQPPGGPPVGVAFAGADGGKPTIPREKFGKLGWGWGIYLQPEFRLQDTSYYFLQNVYKKLKLLGFDTIQGEILMENKASLAACSLFGMAPYAVVYKMNLKDIPNDHDRKQPTDL